MPVVVAFRRSDAAAARRVYAGTSQAAPHAAAAAAVLLQANPGLTPDLLDTLLRTPGRPVTDPRNGLVTPRVDIAAALVAPPPPPQPPPPPPIATVAPTRPTFGRVRLGRARTARVLVRNVGGLPLTISASTTAPFTSAPRRRTIAPAAAEALTVRFAPKRVQAYRWQLTLATNDPARPRVTLVLTGTGARR